MSLIRVISNSVLLIFLTNILSSSYASLFKDDTVSAKTVLTEVSSVLRYDAEVNIQPSDSVENKEAVLEVTEANKDNSKIDNEKTLVLGRSDGCNEYDYKEEKVLRQSFTEENKGVTIGGKATNQIIIIDQNIEYSTENSMVLIHEMIHGLREEEGYKDRLEEDKLMKI